MKEELYLDFGLAAAEDVPLLLDKYVYYFKNVGVFPRNPPTREIAAQLHYSCVSNKQAACSRPGLQKPSSVQDQTGLLQL